MSRTRRQWPGAVHWLALAALAGTPIGCGAAGEGTQRNAVNSGAPSSSASQTPVRPVPRPQTRESARPAQTPPDQYASVPLNRLVGQMVMAGMDGTWPSGELLDAIRAGRIGGLLLFEENVSPHLSSAIAAMQGAAKGGGNPPLLIAVDQEGGSVKRLDGPPTIDTRSIQSPVTASMQGQLTGHFLKRLGINVDLAPVADVTLSPDSFIASEDRGFSGSPNQVATLASAFAAGLQARGVAATGKHFPGVGALHIDTDNLLGIVRPSGSTVDDGLIPFEMLVNGGIDMIMVANAAYPSLDPSGRSAGFSRMIISGLLRRQLGFQDVIITDALDTPSGLGGSSADRAVRAADAGADIILFAPPGDGPLAFAGLLAAAHSHELSRARLERSYGRLVALKKRVARSPDTNTDGN